MATPQTPLIFTADDYLAAEREKDRSLTLIWL